MPVTEPLFEGLKKAFDAARLREVIKGGFYNGDPPSSAMGIDGQGKVLRPYLIINPVAEAPYLFSNRGQYDEVKFECCVIYDTFEEAGGVLIAAVEAALKSGFLAGLITVGSATLKLLRPGRVRYEEVLKIYRVTQEWNARTGKAV